MENYYKLIAEIDYLQAKLDDMFYQAVEWDTANSLTNELYQKSLIRSRQYRRQILEQIESSITENAK